MKTMNRQEIIDYIEQNLKLGYSMDQIEQVLSSHLPQQEYKEIANSYRQRLNNESNMNNNSGNFNNYNNSNSNINYNNSNYNNQAQSNTQSSPSSSQNNNFKKTPYVWIIIVITSLFVLSGIFSVISSIGQITNPAEIEEDSIDFNLDTTPLLITLALNVIGVIINILFIISLAKMNISALKWTHIAFGYDILSDIIGIIVVGFLFPGLAGGIMALLGVFVFIIFVPVTIIFWVTFYIHLKKIMKPN